MTIPVQELWLTALSEGEPSAEDVRRWWNLKETDELDDLLAGAPRLRLGTLTTSGPELPSPTRRVFALRGQEMTRRRRQRR